MRNRQFFGFRNLAILPLLLTLATGVPAQQSSEPASGIRQGQSGYEDIPEFGGPESVSSQLRTWDQVREARYEFSGLQRAFDPYFEWKRQLEDEFGVAFGFQYYLLPQYASESLSDKDATGSIFRFQGSWTFFGRDGVNPGRIEWRVENRTNLWGRQSPSELGSAIGAAALNSGFAYSPNFGTDLAVLNWTQGFRDSTTGIAAGRLAFDVYMDAMPFQTFSRGFLNRAFVVNPTLATTGIGALGFVAKGYLNNQIYIGGQVYDGNAASGRFDMDTVREGEWLSAVEIGWTPDFGIRNKKRVQFTYWHKDARQMAGVPSGRGWAVSAFWQLNDKYFPFIRFGDSDGGAGVAAESSFTAGLEITTRTNEVWSVGAGWARPSEDTHGPGKSDEFVIETSYKLQLARNLSLMPDLQLLFNPANNPSESRVWIIGLRMIIVL